MYSCSLVSFLNDGSLPLVSSAFCSTSLDLLFAVALSRSCLMDSLFSVMLPNQSLDRAAVEWNGRRATSREAGATLLPNIFFHSMVVCAVIRSVRARMVMRQLEIDFSGYGLTESQPKREKLQQP